MASVDLRLAVPSLDDAEELASVHVRAWREAYGALLPERSYDDTAGQARRQMWAGRLSEDDARQGDEIVGFVVHGPAVEHQGHPPLRDEQLFALYVLSFSYGQGVGQALLDDALGGRPAQLWVAKDNSRTHRFYEKNRFIEHGTEQTDPDLDGLVEIRMIR